MNAISVYIYSQTAFFSSLAFKFSQASPLLAGLSFSREYQWVPMHVLCSQSQWHFGFARTRCQTTGDVYLGEGRKRTMCFSRELLGQKTGNYMAESSHNRKISIFSDPKTLVVQKPGNFVAHQSINNDLIVLQNHALVSHRFWSPYCTNSQTLLQITPKIFVHKPRILVELNSRQALLCFAWYCADGQSGWMGVLHGRMDGRTALQRFQYSCFPNGRRLPSKKKPFCNPSREHKRTHPMGGEVEGLHFALQCMFRVYVPVAAFQRPRQNVRQGLGVPREVQSWKK